MKMYGIAGFLPSWLTDEVRQIPDSKKGKAQIGGKHI